MKPLEVWTCQMAENLKKKSSKIPKNNYAATMVSAARRQIIGGGGGGAPVNKSRRRRRPQIVGGGGAARPAHGSNWNSFEIGGGEIEVVSSFTGSEVEKEGRCDKEIKRRVAIGKATMIGLEKLGQDKHVSIDTKKDSENINFSHSSVWL